MLYALLKDYKTGFGGQFGVQKDRVDKSAAGWDHVEKVEKHASQKGMCIEQQYGFKNQYQNEFYAIKLKLRT